MPVFLPDSPLYNGQIQSIGPRYCPSIETKIVTFADKNEHHLFLEPEGATTTVGFIAAEHKGIFSMNICVGIYSGNQALSARFLIAGGAVDLTGKKQSAHRTGLQSVTQLGRLKCGIPHSAQAG